MPLLSIEQAGPSRRDVREVSFAQAQELAADAFRERTRRVDSSAYLHRAYLDAERREAADLLRHVIREDGSEEGVAHEAALRSSLLHYARVLAEIAEDDAELPNVRALATRLLTAAGDARHPLSLRVERLRTSPLPLLRMGVALGLADAGRWRDVRAFLADPHPAVSGQARALLDDADLIGR